MNIKNNRSYYERKNDLMVDFLEESKFSELYIIFLCSYAGNYFEWENITSYNRMRGYDYLINEKNYSEII